MSKVLDKSKVEQAFERAGRTAVAGSRDARAGKFRAATVYFVREGSGRERTSEGRQVPLVEIVNAFPNAKCVWFEGAPTFNPELSVNHFSGYDLSSYTSREEKRADRSRGTATGSSTACLQPSSNRNFQSKRLDDRPAQAQDDGRRVPGLGRDLAEGGRQVRAVGRGGDRQARPRRPDERRAVAALGREGRDLSGPARRHQAGRSSLLRSDRRRQRPVIQQQARRAGRARLLRREGAAGRAGGAEPADRRRGPVPQHADDGPRRQAAGLLCPAEPAPLPRHRSRPSPADPPQAGHGDAIETRIVSAPSLRLDPPGLDLDLAEVLAS